MPRATPDREYVAPVARVRVRYAKRGRMRFASHRDLQRALERGLRRADVPMAYSAGFNPHPRISYANAAPTGTASEAEYAELALAADVDPDELADRLNAALPNGFDIVRCVPAPDGFVDRLEASLWRVELPDLKAADVSAAVDTLMATEQVIVSRMTKKGRREFNIREQLVAARCDEDPPGYAILTLVVRHGTPSVRPDDVLVGLSQVAALTPPTPPVVTRLAQGPLGASGFAVSDPLVLDN